MPSYETSRRARGDRAVGESFVTLDSSRMGRLYETHNLHEVTDAAFRRSGFRGVPTAWKYCAATACWSSGQSSTRCAWNTGAPADPGTNKPLPGCRGMAASPSGLQGSRIELSVGGCDNTRPSRIAGISGAMNAHPLRVLIAEDNADLRDLLVTLVSAEPDLNCVGTADDVDAVIAYTAENKVDVLVLDLELQGRSSIDVLKTVRGEGSKSRLSSSPGTHIRNDSSHAGRGRGRLRAEERRLRAAARRDPRQARAHREREGAGGSAAKSSGGLPTRAGRPSAPFHVPPTLETPGCSQPQRVRVIETLMSNFSYSARMLNFSPMLAPMPAPYTRSSDSSSNSTRLSSSSSTPRVAS